MASLFAGKQLQSPSGEKVDAATLAGKTLGLYFSAHWCRPCQMFTPELVKWFGNFKANAANKDDFEIVFVSSDRDDDSFSHYYATMTGFHALPFAERDTKAELSSKFGIQGIPSFVIVDADGNLITKKGRSIPDSDPTGAEFPWKPEEVWSVVQKAKFLSKKGEVSFADQLANKYVGFYFSASWCGPCKAFTPSLIETYNKVVGAGKNFEIVFVSSDRDDDSFNHYYEKMPWLALPRSDSKTAQALAEEFEVSGIPMLVIVGPDGKLVNDEGRSAIGADKEGAKFPWLPEQVMELTSETLGGINKSPSLMALVPDLEDKDNIARVKALLEELAQDQAYANLKFFYSSFEDEEALESLQNFAKLKAENTLVLMDIPAQCKYLAPANAALDKDTITQFLQGYINKTLTKTSIR